MNRQLNTPQRMKARCTKARLQYRLWNSSAPTQAAFADVVL